MWSSNVVGIVVLLWSRSRVWLWLRREDPKMNAREVDIRRRGGEGDPKVRKLAQR